VIPMSQNCITVWNNCLRIIRQHVGEQSFETWFKPIKPVKLADSILTIQVPSQFFYEWLEEHYVQILRKAIHVELGKKGRLQYSIVVDKGNPSQQPFTINIPNKQAQTPQTGALRLPDNKKTPVTEEKHNPFVIKPIKPNARKSNLNERYTFNNFIEGGCNKVARSAGVAVAQKPGITAFNPFLVYGGVGLGKTHLVQAIGNEILRQAPQKFVLYVPSDTFITQFVEALRTRRMQDFTNYYLQADVLIIDDIQFLGGKERTQENFFHIFNHLHQLDKQIIMTSDCPPKQLQGLQDRLLSRFKWGLTTDVYVPTYPTRLTIIKNKVESEGIQMSQSVIEYIARNVDTNVRELEGVVISLIAKSSLIRQEINMELVDSVMSSIVSDSKKFEQRTLNASHIQEVIIRYFSLKEQDLMSKSRKKDISIARQMAMYFCQEYTDLSLKNIGKIFGNRDHTTVIHAVRTVKSKINSELGYKETINQIKRELKVL